MPHLVARLRDWPGRRAAAAEVEAAEEDGEVVLERRRDGGRREEVLPRRQDGLHREVLQGGTGDLHARLVFRLLGILPFLLIALHAGGLQDPLVDVGVVPHESRLEETDNRSQSQEISFQIFHFVELSLIP